MQFLSIEAIILLSAFLIGFGIMMYVMLDGFDLGIGILFPWAPDEKTKNVMISTVAPVWDGNSTWLIYTSGILFAAFPIAYSIWLPALYLPIMLMLAAFIFRGAAFEFRLKAKTTRWLWDWAFAIGSTLAAFAQGVILGTVIQGVPVENNIYVGGSFTWTNNFALITGFSLVMGYALLGVCWLIKKSTGETLIWARNIAKPIIGLVMLAILVISIKTPLQYEYVKERWFSLPNFLYLSPIPFLTALCFFGIIYGIVYKKDFLPFLSTVGVYILSFIGLGVTLWPYLVFPHVTIWDAAAQESSLRFIIVVLMFSLPVVCGYSIFVYRVFKGKVEENSNYYKHK